MDVCPQSFERMCRTCLNSGCNLIPLFSPKLKFVDHRNLQRITGLKISVNDGLPQAVCKNCADTMALILNFQCQCYEAERKFQEMITIANETSNDESHPDVDTRMDFDADPSIYSDKNLHNGELSECLRVKDDVNFDCADIKLKHSQDIECSDNKAIRYETKFCKSYKNKLEKLRICKEFSKGPMSLDGPIQCKICKKQSKNVAAFLLHLRIHIGFKHVCEFCGKKFYAAIGLKRHCMSWHGQEKQLSCIHCHYMTVSPTRLKEHERIHAGEKPFECDECGARFHTRSSIIQHLRLHNSSRIFQCDRCPSMFKDRRALTTHIRQSHIRDFVYLCYVCDKRYSKNVTVRNHLAKLHGIAREHQGKIPRFSLSKSAVVN